MTAFFEEHRPVGRAKPSDDGGVSHAVVSVVQSYFFPEDGLLVLTASAFVVDESTEGEPEWLPRRRADIVERVTDRYRAMRLAVEDADAWHGKVRAALRRRGGMVLP